MTFTPTRPRRALFVATILTGSFLLFMVQPLVARMALPQLGGAPNVWNSAMLVYQALLLAGYAYAHRIARLPMRTQAKLHIGLFMLALVTLPISLAKLSAPAPGTEVFWVPALFVLTIGPVFFLVAAQAPLMQRWYSLHPGGGEPWALYAASNLGSFTGLIAYPLVVEPLLSIKVQSWGWTIGYVLLLTLIALCARARWNAPELQIAETAPASAPIPRKTVLLWLALAAVPSGLMLSTTTHLTTDLFAMPLLWVIPLGLYLLSFVFAFSDRRTLAWAITLLAPATLLLAGGLAMISRSQVGLGPVFASVGLLFVVCVALHGRMYDLRPSADRLTFFYLVMSAGGALGGLFTALIAPLLFDWVWEYPILVVAAALLLPTSAIFDWTRLPGQSKTMILVAVVGLVALAGLLIGKLSDEALLEHPGLIRWGYTAALVVIGLLLARWRLLVLTLLIGIMLAQGGLETLKTSRDGLRTRSYFGIYTVRDYPESKIRTLAHGTTLHGEQSSDPRFRNIPSTYYGPGSGVGLAFANSKALYGPNPRIGVVGLGTGSLACYHKPGESWTFFEIDPAVLALSRNRTFTYMSDCAPDAAVKIGDARLTLAGMPRGSLDLLAIDAFSSDAIPLHLLTDEAIGVYLDALSPKGLLLVHISNRYIELEPILSAAAKRRGLAAATRDDFPAGENASLYTASSWVAITRDRGQINMMARIAPDKEWFLLGKPADPGWTDDHASILPQIRWRNLLGSP